MLGGDVCVLISYTELNCTEPLDRCINVVHLVRLTAKVYIKLIQSVEID